MPLNSRSKGASAERELAKLLGEMTGAEWLRNLEQTRSGGADLISPDFPTVALEIKRCEKITLSKWLTQAARQAKPHQTPALAWRQNRRPWQFIIPLSALALDPTAPPAALCQLDLSGFVWWLQRRKC